MKNIFFILLSLSVFGCGVIHETELDAPVIKLEAKPADCEFPKEFDTEAKVLSAISCLESNLDNAFNSLQGEADNELSINELKKLQEAGILEFAVGDSQQWQGLSALLSFIHPAGKEAISRNEIRRFLDWIRTKSNYLSRLANWEQHKGNKAPINQALFQESVEFSDELVAFLSDKGSASLDQAEALLRLVQSNRKEGPLVKDAKRKLPAVWRLKALVLDSTRADDKVVGLSLKRFLKAAVKVARHSEQTYAWWEKDFHPAYAPDNIELEWANIIETTQQYLGQTTTFDLDTEEMRAQVRVLLPEAEFADRIPDLVTASKRLLAHKGDHHTGLLYGLLHLFDGAEKVADSLRSAAKLYAGCPLSDACALPSRQVITNKRVRPVALISTQDWNVKAMGGASDPMPKRRDGQLQWKTVLKRLLEKGVITNIFSAYDRNEDEAIPYKGEIPDDLKEAMDVAYTLISIVSIRNGSEPDTESVPFFIKPSAVVGAIGLLGDEWVVPGNKDGKIDVDEFYAALKVYEDINYIARHSALSLDVLSSLPEGQVSEHLYIPRAHFLKNVGTIYQRELPYLIPVFKELEQKNGGAAKLLDLLVPNGKTASGQAYVGREDMIRPVATLVLLDRLILKCDKNEDELFNWEELDCVAPLALEAGKQLFGSDLMELPPFVSDAATLGLDTLSKKGLPHTLSKTILLNGSTRKVRLMPNFMRMVKDYTHADLKDIAGMFAGLSNEDLRKEISVAVIFAHDYLAGVRRHVWSGGDANNQDIVNGVDEWNSVTSRIITYGIFKHASERTDGLLSRDAMEKIWEELGTDRSKFPRVNALKTLLPFSMVLAAKPAQWQFHFNKTAGEHKAKMDPISPSHLLMVLEGLLE